MNNSEKSAFSIVSLIACLILGYNYLAQNCFVELNTRPGILHT